MRHFSFLDDDERARVFAHEPGTFTPDDDIDTLAVALGATVYAPATRPHLADDIRSLAGRGVMSMVVDLEDAVPDDSLADAERNAVSQLTALHAEGGGQQPLLFLRVREPDQLFALVEGLGAAVGVLSGFVLPKFTGGRGAAMMEAMLAAGEASGRRLLAMPVMESPDIIHVETRTQALQDVRELLEKHRSHVLAVRVGATDLCAAYGVRRGPAMTVYDVRLVADVIADVVNLLGRADGSGWVITGPVWEYFTPGERHFKPLLRESPFEAHHEDRLRARMIDAGVDGLIREIELDRVNGMLGKTVIHPSHVSAVHALSVVTAEEYEDAMAISSDTAAAGGVLASKYGNKMNEVKPHRAWARRTLQRASAFGVARESIDFVDLLTLGS